ncbi:MAG: SRPBCC family protein [Bacteroidia bacterium]|nr:SRPBCC family protein [Bacteroidia bacterium]
MQYSFTTVWHVMSGIEPVWQAINDVEQWPQWWPGVNKVEQLKPGGVGQINVLTWKSILPYTLKFKATITEVRTHKLITAQATGELEGSGQWVFEQLAGNQTKLTYYWQVRTTKMWMNLLAPLAFIFRYNHHVVMNWGGKGLGQKLGCKVEVSHL